MSDSKILIIRLSSIGDILLTTQFIRLLREKYPQARIDYVVKKEFAILLQNNSRLSGLICYDRNDPTGNLPSLRRRIKKTGYDYILDLHNNWRSNMLRRGLSGAVMQHIRKDKWKQQQLVRLRKNRYNRIVNIPERYLEVGAVLGLEDDGKGLELPVAQMHETSAMEKLYKNGFDQQEKYLAIAPGAGFFTPLPGIHGINPALDV